MLDPFSISNGSRLLGHIVSDDCCKNAKVSCSVDTSETGLDSGHDTGLKISLFIAFFPYFLILVAALLVVIDRLQRGEPIFFFLFVFIGESATKRFAGSRIFRYGLPQDILSERQRKREGGAYSAPTPML